MDRKKKEEGGRERDKDKNREEVERSRKAEAETETYILGVGLTRAREGSRGQKNPGSITWEGKGAGGSPVVAGEEARRGTRRNMPPCHT